MLNGNEIVSFVEQHADGPAMPGARFDLGDALQQVREAEIARVVGIAGDLLHRFAPEIAVGFLFYEVLGRPPDLAESASQGGRLRRTPSAARTIVDEFFLSNQAGLGLRG